MSGEVSLTRPVPWLDHACALLRGDELAWPLEATAVDTAEFLRVARFHGVTPLLDARFAAIAGGGTWPESIHQACRHDAVAYAMRELAQRAEVVEVLAALAAAGVDALLLKGSGLAYSHYAQPAQRPRADCDILVAPQLRDAAGRALDRMGYRRVAGPTGPGVGFQIEMRRDDSRGVAHSVDLHWRISNAQSFAWLFAFEDLARASVPVPALGRNARRLGDAHALTVSLLHRVLNNRFIADGYGDRLIWLYDIRLLVEAMTCDDRQRFGQLVEDAEVVAIAIDGLRLCAARLASPHVAALAADLERSPEARSGKALLGTGQIGREWLELCAVPTAAARVRYIASRLFPSADYLRERFPDAAGRPLPLLHAKRWLAGLARGTIGGR